MEGKTKKRPRPPNSSTEARKKQAAENQRHAVHFPRPSDLQTVREQLPVFMHEQEIIEALRHHDAIVVTGATGSGKTTQVPQFLLEEFMGAASDSKGGIVVTQPRRVAAVACAKRVSAELGEMTVGGLVGYHVRHEPNTGPRTRLKFVTDGVLLREIEHDLLLSKYDAVVIDEAHERSLNTDLLLALLSRSLVMRRSTSTPLKMVVMSATLDIDGIFSGDGALFPNSPCISVASRQYPVTTHFARTTRDDYMAEAFKKVCQIHTRLPSGGVLVFVSGRREVMQLCEQIEAKFKDTKVRPQGMSYSLSVRVLPFYALLPENQQHTVFDDFGSDVRKIIVATNVAETSVTIPGISYVVDTGKVKEQVYRGAGGGLLSTFEVRWVSKASAEQRAGRAGRTGPGHAYRLYSSAVFDQQFLDFRVAEVCRVPADSIVLRLRTLGIRHVNKFPFPTKPDPVALLEAQDTLECIGALERSSRVSSNLTDINGTFLSGSSQDVLLGVTSVGRELAKLPLPPRFARILVAAKLSSPHSVQLLCRVAAMLSVGTVFDRCNTDAIAKHNVFAHPSSDVLSQLNAICLSESEENLRIYCAAHALHFKTMAEVLATARQLESSVMSKEDGNYGFAKLQRRSKQMDTKILRCIICGFPDKIARRLSRDEAAAYGVQPRWMNSAFMVCGYRDVVYMSSRSTVRLNSEVQFVIFTALVSAGENKPRKKIVEEKKLDDGSDEDSNPENEVDEPEHEAEVEVEEEKKKARTIMENVSVVSGAWIAQNATSMCVFEISTIGRATQINPVQSKYSIEEDSAMIAMQAKYGSSRWPLGTLMVPYRAAVRFLKANSSTDPKILRNLRESACTSFANAVQRGDAKLKGYSGSNGMSKKGLRALTAELIRKDICSTAEWDQLFQTRGNR